ncbi:MULTISPECIES: ABC transporter permease [Lachnospiraceae]|jgi:putative aldouronate transport system permease protein|uniref:ABC transporter permease subunit n=1 Tax=Faecalicatena acetigenes TaxID=2981790 RepID=A0ABT2T787_9FIRM|nr:MULTISPECIES: ABC transporter permease subunit [Lachnospiraceae]MCU6746130.1 ABC transporter permease subunit [Faecalicatena acetigenes]RGT74993.1 sugar ABC transporter permease [Ruminococcus sp. AF18-22]SCG96984.1 Inner membrane ABC transporter permease protein ycjO [uncultured Clostridium sp.]
MKLAKTKTQKRKFSLRRMKRYMPLYLMLVPGLIYLIINNYLPMAGLSLAFKKVNYSIGLFDSPWCGWDNFKFLFGTKDAFLIFRNTILYNLAFIFIGNALGVFVAICLDSIYNKFFKRFSQVIILIPYLLSTVIISYIVFAFLSGNNGFMNNTILPLFGIDPISWYNEAKYWPVIIVLVYLWMSFGYSSILYYSTLIGIDKSYYEAAAVDGAGIWAQIRHITLPALKPTIIILILLAIGRICYSDFGLFYQVPMNSGLLYSTTQTIDTYVYRALLELNDIGRSTAGGFLQSILGFVCVFTANFVVSKIDKDSSLF